MKTAVSLALAAATLALGLSACQDAVTAPDAAQPGIHVSPLNGSGGGTLTPYMCTITQTGPRGTWVRQEALNIPVALHAADGRSMEYRYRRQTPGGTVTHAADCVIPRTMGALEHMNQRFRVPPELGTPKAYAHAENEFTIQGCVSDGLCILEPIVVEAPVEEEEQKEEDGGSPHPGTGGGGDPGAGGGGGSSYFLPALSDDGIQNPVLPDCTKTQTGAWQKAYCAGAPANGTTLTETNRALNRIRAKGGECANIAARGDSLLANSQIRYFNGSGADLRGWGHPQVGVILDSRVIGRGAPYNHDLFLVHEIEHAMGRGHTGQDADGVDMTPNDRACS